MVGEAEINGRPGLVDHLGYANDFVLAVVDRLTEQGADLEVHVCFADQFELCLYFKLLNVDDLWGEMK